MTSGFLASVCYYKSMQLEFPYQIVTFLDKEPEPNEPVYYSSNGWYPQLALKRRFKLVQTNEESLVESLKEFFGKRDSTNIETGALIRPDLMPVRVIEIINQAELKDLHTELIEHLRVMITSRYPDREGENYYAHITAEYNDEFVFPVDEYTNREFPLDNVWLLKDVDDENSLAHIKIK